MSARCVCAIGLLAGLAAAGCGSSRWSSAVPETSYPRQGDLVRVRLNAGNKSELERIDYDIGGVTGFSETLPIVVDVDTCKDSPDVDTYYDTLEFEYTLTYDDETSDRGGEWDLTTCHPSREENPGTYAIFTAPSEYFFDDQRTADTLVEELDRLEIQYRAFNWDSFHDEGGGKGQFDSVDLAVLFGHGGPGMFGTYYLEESFAVHELQLGGLAHCGTDEIGELETVAFFSCRTLDVENWPAWWFADHETRMTTRPFAGLHMALGFRTDVETYAITIGESSNQRFFRLFANRIDAMWSVREAWLESVGDELFSLAALTLGWNRGAVIYIDAYEHDGARTIQPDYIFPDHHYLHQVIEYWTD